MYLIKPSHLKSGDTVATVSLSWGGAGDQEIRWRYEQGKRRLKQEFGLEVIEMPHTLKGSDYLYHHPEKRAQDLMDAFLNPNIKAIFSCIGGEESIRLLPFIDFDIIKNNPKIFLGYSDSTITHLICLKASLTSFYGPSILCEFAENIEMFNFTKEFVLKTLFETKPIGEIKASPIWTSDFVPWMEENKNIQRRVEVHEGYEWLQGEEVVEGHLIGGCMDVLEMAKGTIIWPTLNQWRNSIIFFETSEDKPDPKLFEYWLRNYGSQGILQSAKGIMFGKSYDNIYAKEYKQVIIKVIKTELGLTSLPIIFNMNFGHTSPMFTIPYGAKAQINCKEKTFKILSSGVKS